jgi:hypothetical protein
MMNTLAARIKQHGYPTRLEPCLGDTKADELMSFLPRANWAEYGRTGQSVLTLMVDMREGGGFACMWCEHRPHVPELEETVDHIRERHFNLLPFSCGKVHSVCW